MKKNTKHFLSVIIPAYQKETTIKDNLIKVHHTLEHIRYDYELIIVVDGTKADSTYQQAKLAKLSNTKVYGYKKNRGKGHAIRYGVTKAKGDYVLFLDAGLEIDPNGISMLLEHLEWYQADVVVGSKRHPASQIDYPLNRQIISFGAQLIARFLLGIKVKDTQAGIKIYKMKVLKKICPRLLVKTFAIDLEMLSVANRLGFTRIFEAPIKLRFDFEDFHLNGNTLKTIYVCLKDALAVFYRLKILKYYDDATKRKFFYDKDLKIKINTG